MPKTQHQTNTRTSYNKTKHTYTQKTIVTPVSYTHLDVYKRQGLKQWQDYIKELLIEKNPLIEEDKSESGTVMNTCNSSGKTDKTGYTYLVK